MGPRTCRRFLLLLAFPVLSHFGVRAAAAQGPPSDPLVAGAARSPAAAAVEKPLPTADELLQKYETALGGQEVWSRFKTLAVKGIYQSEDDSAFAGIEILAESPDKLFVRTTFSNGVTIRQVCDGKSAWLEGPNGRVHELTGAALEGSLRESQFGNPAEVLRRLGGPGRVLGTGRVGTHSVYIVAFEPDKRISSRVYFDVASGLAVRTDDTFHRDGGDYTIETYTDDFRLVDGAYYPFHLRHVEKGNVFTVRVTQLKNNAPVDETIFMKTSTVVGER